MQDFKLKIPLSRENLAYKNQILQTQDSVFVHIRRGDYLLSTNVGYAKLGQTYYANAITFIRSKIKNPHFFIFSNDIQWCKENFIQVIGNHLESSCVTFVDCNNEGNAIQEIELMRSCQHGIITNSTFSWWAGYLIESTSKICILPDYYGIYDEIKNLIPSNSYYLIDHIWGRVYTREQFLDQLGSQN